MASELLTPDAMQAPGLADQDDESSLPKIKIGICAMDKKAKSKPMKAILQRLLAFGEFEVELFGDDNILNKPVNRWPHCDCLLSWHSEGFPLKKVSCFCFTLLYGTGTLVFVHYKHHHCIHNLTMVEP